jgi:hypothetical protein
MDVMMETLAGRPDNANLAEALGELAANGKLQNEPRTQRQKIFDVDQRIRD